MVKKEKLIESAQNSTKNVKFNVLIKLAEHYGFVLDRQKGSHVIMKHPKVKNNMNFQEVKGEAKPYQVKQLLNVIKEFDL